MLADTVDRQREIIGERTLLQRRRCKLSQRELAHRLDWGPNRIGQVELAKTDLNILEIYALAAELECRADYLLGIVDSPTEVAGSPTGWFGYPPPGQQVYPGSMEDEHPLAHAA